MIPGSTGTCGAGSGHPVPQPQVVLGGEQHLGDRVVGAGVDLVDQEPGVGFQVGRARVFVRVGSDPDLETAERAGQADQLTGVFEALRVRDPLAVRVARRVAAQRQDVPDPNGRIRSDHLTQLGHRMPDGRQVGDRHQGGFLGNPLGDPDGPLPVRAAGAVGDRNERRPQRFQPADGAPEHVLVGVIARRHELHREVWAGRGKSVANGRHVRSLLGTGHRITHRHRADWAGGPESTASGDHCRTGAATRRADRDRSTIGAAGRPAGGIRDRRRQAVATRVPVVRVDRRPDARRRQPMPNHCCWSAPRWS